MVFHVLNRDVANNIANQPLIFETAIPRARLRGSTR